MIRVHDQYISQTNARPTKEGAKMPSSFRPPRLQHGRPYIVPHSLTPAQINSRAYAMSLLGTNRYWRVDQRHYKEYRERRMRVRPIEKWILLVTHFFFPPAIKNKDPSSPGTTHYDSHYSYLCLCLPWSMRSSPSLISLASLIFLVPNVWYL